MNWKGVSRKAGERMRVGRRTIGVPSVPSMADSDPPPPSSEPSSAPASRSDRQPPIDRTAVQYLDRVRAIFRPANGDRLANGDALAPGLERFVGTEHVFRHVGAAPFGAQPMMQCPPHWSVTWVPIADLEILEILEDQDVRAG